MPSMPSMDTGRGEAMVSEGGLAPGHEVEQLSALRWRLHGQSLMARARGDRGIDDGIHTDGLLQGDGDKGKLAQGFGDEDAALVEQ